MLLISLLNVVCWGLLAGIFGFFDQPMWGFCALMFVLNMGPCYLQLRDHFES